MKSQPRYVVCVSDQGNELSVLKGKLYRVLSPEAKDKPTVIRIVDETGEDYLYDRSWFVPIKVPQAVSDALSTA